MDEKQTPDQRPDRCEACAAPLTGRFCAACGQSAEDYRRSFLSLAKDYAKDAFAADSRAVRTVVRLARSPGRVPASYMQGDRTTYTPPVRLFLIVSFVFFVTLSFADTLFIAIEVRHTPPTAAELGIAGLDPDDPETAERTSCGFGATGRFFVRARDIEVDTALWERCSGELSREIDEALAGDPRGGAYSTVLNRLIAGMGRAIQDPRPLNNEANVWLGRFMIVMVPLLALMLGAFFRGPQTFLFDHMIFSLYTHSAAFVLLAVGVWGVHLGLQVILGAAVLGVFVYFLLSLRGAYRRGWIKTGLAALLVGLAYMIVLTLGGIIIPAAILVSA
ncbi:DUF3667 domain-containing protein [Hyphomonas sp.]|uniref:DUF3667 domain-containing protein n=1 Tax=Hyphomonas sp. TaxID=87 RepID=UPI00391A40DE